jgi:hypothetical protein
MNKIMIIGASRGIGPGISAGKQRHIPVLYVEGIRAGKIFGADVANFMIASITSKEYSDKTQLLTY